MSRMEFHNLPARYLKECGPQLVVEGLGRLRMLRMNAQKFRAKVGHSQKTNLPSFLLYREI